ncbi:MAG TPA: VWA domain-containing protein [Gemmataceae bacterium]|nr:VWA domain-containing protein [Gemmataceae bacterium]
MRVRHRIPSIFNLSMVDVLCCALGCVILLWLLNLREAKYHQESAEEQHRETTAQLDNIRVERDRTIGMLMRLQAQVEAVEEEKSDLQKYLSAQQVEAADVSRRLAASAKHVAALERDLSDRTKRHEAEMARADSLERKLKDATGRVVTLEKDLRDSEKRGDTETARGRELAGELTTAKKRLKDLQTTANLVPTLRSDLREAREQYGTEKALASALEKEISKRMRELKDADKNLDNLLASRRSLERDLEGRDKELALAKRSMATLQIEKKKVESEAARVRAAAENRFAGIALTGRRVVFLVDMSGSMDLVDENTQAPRKWAEVRDTVARLMRSMPDLEKFQVIVFAEKAEFLLKGDEEWWNYEAASSPERVLRGLAAVKPKGGTNMYAALQTAFRMRDKGLDTIYLLSDGLPNLGEGLTGGASSTLKELERNDLLAKYIRKTLKTDWNRARPQQSRVRINTIGFFFESPDVGAFLWALARENDGSFVGMSRP